jgi:hypothetical protein
MATTCEVVGWLLDGTDGAKVLVRDGDDNAATQARTLEDTFGQLAIQTGSFRRGNRIIDPLTQQTLGYEMERLSNRIDIIF